MSNNKGSRAANGVGYIHKRDNGVWEGTCTIGYDERTGKRKRKSVYGKTQKEVRQKLSVLSTQLDTKEYFEPSKMTLSDWLDIWTRDYMLDKKYSTIKHYKAAVNNHIKPCLGRYKLSDLSIQVVQRFYNSLAYPSDGSAPLAAKTIHNIHGVLSKALNQAVSNDFIRANPCNRAVLPKAIKPDIKPLTQEQVKEMLLISEEDPVYGILLKVIILTGMRVSEATGLTWDCINFDTNTIIVCKQLQKRPKGDGGFAFESPKNSKTRTLKPAPYVMELLKKRQAQQSEQKLYAGPLWDDWTDPYYPKERLVFTTLTGSYLSPQTVYNHFKVIANKIGAPDARVHDLRHTFAVISLENGDDPKTLQGNLGHATAAFTLDVYGHFSDKMKDASAERMQGFVTSLFAV